MAGPDSPQGLLLADKPAGPTSHDVVRAARRALRGARSGHAGTLDPFATGLLLLLVGRATRLAEYASDLDKTYAATLRLGAASTTGDPEGEISELSPSPPPPPRAALEAALAGLEGERDQVPPLFSAKRVAGQRAYRMARRSAVFVLAPRRVRIERVELLSYEYPRVSLRVTTGPGAYVRSLARDLGEALGSAAYLTALRRESIGPFSVTEAVDVRGRTGDELAARLLPPERAVAHLPVVHLDAGAARALVQGRPAPLDELPRHGAPSERFRLVAPGGFLGVGMLEPSGVRAVKVLYPERADS